MTGISNKKSAVTTATTRVAAVELAAQSGMFTLKALALFFARTLDATSLPLQSAQKRSACPDATASRPATPI